jgi:hypothetical protein
MKQSYIRIQNYKGYWNERSIRIWIGSRFYMQFDYKKRKL